MNYDIFVNSAIKNKSKMVNILVIMKLNAYSIQKYRQNLHMNNLKMFSPVKEFAQYVMRCFQNLKFIPIHTKN